MFKRLAAAIIFMSLSLSIPSQAEHTDLYAFHSAIKAKDAFTVSMLLFGTNLATLPIEKMPVGQFSDRVETISALLNERNGEGESADLLLMGNPNVFVARLIHFARSLIASSQQ